MFLAILFHYFFLDKDTGDGFETAMRSAHLEDSGDCIKRLLCELQSKKDQDLPWDEILIKKSVASKIDYMSPILQLQLAVDLGTKQGPKQCSVVYSRLVLRYLKPVCCMKKAKKVPTKKLVWGIGDIRQ